MTTATLMEKPAKAAAKPAAAVAAETVPVKPVEIDPKRCTLHGDGQCWREWQIVLPPGVIADDLKRPELFRRVQADRTKALQRHDKIYVIAGDDSWSAEGRITSANNSGAVAAMQRIIPNESRIEQALESEDYKVQWVNEQTGVGFAVMRKADGRRVSEIFHSKMLAERALIQQYPKMVG